MAIQSKTLRRLGLIENWNWPLLWFALPFYVLFTILYDAVLTGNGSYLWLITFVSASFVEILFVVVSKKLFLTKLLNRWPSGWIGGTFAGLVNVVRNCTVAALALQLGLLQTVDWGTRIAGAYFMGVAIMILYVSILGSRVEHTSTMHKLHVIQRSLLEHRKNSSILLNEENQRLLDQAQSLLLPRIEKIQQLLLEKHADGDPLQELRALVAEHVRPLSTELSSTAKVLSLKEAPVEVKRIKTGFMAPRVNLAKAIRPGLILMISGVGQWFMVNMLAGGQKATLTAVGVVIGWLFIVATKSMIPKHLVIKRSSAIMLLSLIGFISAIPVALINLSTQSTQSEWALYSMLILSPIFSLVGFAIATSLDVARDNAEKRLQKDNQALARETALFDQRMWIAKRSWSFVIHGTVQAALTAAITRLSAAEPLEQYQIDLVRQDLTRAANALSKTPETEVDLQVALNDLVTTWSGIVAIKFEISERAQRSLQKDSNARMCVNEICKEAVSNAVRHGEAKKIDISIDRTADELLIIEAADDGRGFWGSVKPGVGSRMLDDLTVSWSIANNRARARTVLTATLPLAGISADAL